MASKGFRLDMTMMYAVHDAFRRELGRLARITSREDDDPARILSVAAGWEMLKTYLRLHDGAENDGLWPAMWPELVRREEEAQIVEAMEVEHAAIEPKLEAIDAALADRDGAAQRLPGLVDGLIRAVEEHLGHEEREGLPLVDRMLSEEQWSSFGDLHRRRVSPHVSHYLPWLLDGTTADKAAHVLARLPEAVRRAYQDEWRAAYAQLELWGDGNGKANGQASG